MLGIDINVLVRFLVRDDPEQFERARRLIRRELGGGETVLISLLVLLETEWVLRSRYNVAKAEIGAALSALLGAVELEFEDEPSVEEAVFIWRDSATEFADCLINARHRALGCRATATFDVRASKLFGFVAACPYNSGRRVSARGPRIYLRDRAPAVIRAFGPAVSVAPGRHGLVLWRWIAGLPTKVTVYDPSGKISFPDVSHCYAPTALLMQGGDDG